MAMFFQNNKHLLKKIDFSVLPGTFRFGADEDLTVITAYLEETETLLEKTKMKCRRHVKKYDFDHIVAFIAVYDVEYGQLDLYVILQDNIQVRIPLQQLEANSLYAAMQYITKKTYEMQMEDILNTIRRSQGKADIFPIPFS